MASAPGKLLDRPPAAELAEPQRLALVLTLARAGRTAFAELAGGLRLTDGNLACHLRRLSGLGWVAVYGNGARGRASRTEYALTPAGIQALALAGEAFAATAQALERAVVAAATETPLRSGVADGMDPARRASARAGSHVAPPLGSLIEERFSGPD